MFIDNIKSAKYIKDITGDNNSTVKITLQDDTNNWVPMTNDNSDYIVVQEWAAIDGNTIADAD
jgi:hypothetical protein